MKRNMALVHPGRILEMELVDGRGLAIDEAAQLFGVASGELSCILDGRSPITPEISARIAASIGGSAALWSRLQSSCDLYITGMQL